MLDCAVDATNTCTRCLGVKYCSQEHQKLDWKEHRKVCIAPPKVPDVKCSSCGGWGLDLVKENGKCDHCTAKV